jgi:KaiC/GvpD/RAD55 family RecA-like ATPase
MGVHVYRRAQSRPVTSPDQPTSEERMSTGSRPSTSMMDGGIYKGSVTLVSGISGTGKTVLSVQFLSHAIKCGHKALLVSLDEHPRQLIRNASRSVSTCRRLVDAGQLFIHYESPLELELDVHFDRIVKLVEQEQIDCVVFDSIAVYEMTSRAEVADYLYALASFFKNRLATTLFNYESPELLGVSQISEELKGSHLVDNIILLNYVEISTVLRRALAVPKVRGSRNVQITREYDDRRGRPAAGGRKRAAISSRCRSCRSRPTTACCRARHHARVRRSKKPLPTARPCPTRRACRLKSPVITVGLPDRHASRLGRLAYAAAAVQRRDGPGHVGLRHRRRAPYRPPDGLAHGDAAGAALDAVGRGRPRHRVRAQRWRSKPCARRAVRRRRNSAKASGYAPSRCCCAARSTACWCSAGASPISARRWPASASPGRSACPATCCGPRRGSTRPCRTSAWAPMRRCWTRWRARSIASAKPSMT